MDILGKYIMARPRGIEPRSQAPEAYVISIGPRAQIRVAKMIIGYLGLKSKRKARFCIVNEITCIHQSISRRKIVNYTEVRLATEAKIG